MKLALNSTDSIVNSRGTGSSATFGIASNSQMFQILSSGLYSDKVSAVLREVGCNAFDAHVAVGKKDIPIEVKLPTSLDSTFYIKDFGPGLDDDEIKSIYTVYGISTKSACFEQTGGFGLGSKSPFAYTLFDSQNPDGFTVISAKNGVQRVYVAHLNDEGAPSITLLSEGPASSDWPTGVQVQFPVQAADFKEFHDKALEVFKWFEVAPKIIGTTDSLEDTKFTYLVTANDCKVYHVTEQYSKGYYHLRDTSSVVMANVKYPISAQNIIDEVLRSEASKEVKEAIDFLLKC